MLKLALLLALIASSLGGQQPLIDEGFTHFFNLDYDQAIAVFEKAIAQYPGLPDLHNHLAQTLIFREMFRNGALESELVSGSNSFLRRPKLNPNDTASMYASGIALGLRSNYFWVVKKAWHDALRDATAARKLHNRISELEPNNVDARLVQGLHDYIVGSLPLGYKMLGFLIGVRGDKAKGILTVQDVAKNGKLNRVDAEVFLCALYRRENQSKLAGPLVQDLIRRYPRNYLLRMELGQMYSQSGDSVRGLQALEEVARLKQRHAPGFDRVPWEKIYYQEGSIQFWYNDLDQSLENMKKVASAGEEVDLNTGVQALLRMGQIYDMKQRRAEAIAAYKKAIAYAPQAEAAQESRKYLDTPYRRM